LATRSRRMISMIQFSLLQDVGKQAQKAGALDGLGELALLLGANRRDAAWHDLATLGNVTLQKAHILVINLGRTFTGEGAAFPAPEKGAAGGLFHSH
jgi:hypothetical protein